nr:ribonuclease H-like domain-containing protein [Tanacetum cinerariifolium]
MDLKWQMAMLTMRARRFFKNTGRKLNLTENDSVAFDKNKVECYNYHKRGHFARECQAPRGQDNRSQDVTRNNVPIKTPNSSELIIECQIVDNYKKELGCNAVPPPHIGLFPPPKSDLSSTRLEELFNGPKTKNSKDKSNAVKPKSVRKHSDTPIIEDWVSDNEEEEVEQKEVKPSINRINLVIAITDNNQKETVKTGEQPKQNTYRKRGNQRNWKGMMSYRLGSNWEMFNKSCYECGSFEHLIRNCQHHQNKIEQQKVLKPMWNNIQLVNHKNYSNAKRNHVRQASLTVNAARPINGFPLRDNECC